ncbi:epidermal growth factor-like protein 7 [Drosophila mauritiana]|uniref:Epidermal growth factor-like protein 7 n=1 Tax=Drosophila mauritiana TaxID=7226 RepID=A0A6P8L7U2_DROMA|nr:epidermal growth factor-like protein 7 [Drosophila mauritiana]
MASMLHQVLYPVLGLVLMTIHLEVSSLAITNGHCQKNISVKYQVPVAKTRMAGAGPPNASHPVDLDSYVVYEERVRWDNIQVCCPGYRTILFGFCEPVCQEACPAHSYCAEPDRCHCQRGYEPSHHHTTGHQLVCRPVCQGGCPEHSHCVAHNECECWPGFKDASSWFSMSLRCERVQCGHEQRFDPGRRACVQIEMSMEELMQRVAERLAKGLGAEEEAANEPES